MGGEVKNMRRAFLAMSAFVLLAGCGSPGPVAGGNYKLYEAASARTVQLVAVIDTQSRATERRLPWGIPSTDGKHFFSVSAKTLQDIDPHTGTVLRTLQLPSIYELPAATLGGAPGGLSQNGRFLVVQTAGQSTSSHMLLIDTHLFTGAKPIALNATSDFHPPNHTRHALP